MLTRFLGGVVAWFLLLCLPGLILRLLRPVGGQPR
jgi:hypothetical protein